MRGRPPGAVLFDALQAAKARNIDVVLCDTAGRLHNKQNLMNELAKLRKIIDRELPEAGRETLLVLDATTGQKWAYPGPELLARDGGPNGHRAHQAGRHGQGWYRYRHRKGAGRAG